MGIRKDVGPVIRAHVPPTPPPTPSPYTALFFLPLDDRAANLCRDWGSPGFAVHLTLIGAPPFPPGLNFFFLSLRLCVLRNPTTSMPTTHTSCILISSLVVSGYCPPQLSIDNTPSFM